MQFWSKASFGQVCVVFFKFGPVVQEEMSIKYISYLELCQPLFLQSKITCAILVEGIMSNNSVELF